MYPSIPQSSGRASLDSMSSPVGSFHQAERQEHESQTTREQGAREEYARDRSVPRSQPAPECKPEGEDQYLQPDQAVAEEAEVVDEPQPGAA